MKKGNMFLGHGMLLSNRSVRKSRIDARGSSPSWLSLWLPTLGLFWHGLAGGDGVVALAPLIAVGRIDELEVEAFVGQRVVGKGTAERR